MKILSVKDRIQLKYTNQETQEEVVFVIRPLTVAQKMEVTSQVKMVKGEEVADFHRQAFLCIKYAVVEAYGLTHSSGEPYQLAVTPEGLDEATTDDLVEFMSSINMLANTYYAANKMLDKVEGAEVSVLPK